MDGRGARGKVYQYLFQAAVKKEKRITFNASFKPAVAWLEDSYG